MIMMKSKESLAKSNFSLSIAKQKISREQDFFDFLDQSVLPTISPLLKIYYLQKGANVA